MPTEVEAKFLAADQSVLDALAREVCLGEAELGPGRTFEELDRYLDTTDGRLAAAQWACRLRDRGEGPIVSLKGPATDVSESGVHRRPEVEGPATASLEPADWPPSEARDLLIQLSGGEAMTERLRLQQRRTERAVRLSGHRLGTLSLDTVTVGRGDLLLGEELHVVELELAVDDVASVATLERLAATLAARSGLRPDPRSKLEHALAHLYHGRSVSHIGEEELVVVERVLAEVEQGLADSLAALDADQAASPVLRAVVEEFGRKFAKTRELILGADERLSRESLIELEQAADSARYAALADPGAAAGTRDRIVETHDWVCTYKVTGQLLRPDA